MDGVNGTVSCGDFNDLKKRVNHLEYEDLKEVRTDIQHIRENMTRSAVLLEQNITSSEKLTNTLDTVQKTLVQLTESMKNNNEATRSLSLKVSNLEEKIDAVEDSGKLDMKVWFQKNWVNVILLAGIIIYTVLGQYVKF